MKNEFIGISEVSEWLGLSVQGIYKMVREKRIPSYKIDSTHLFKKSELEKWIKSKKVS